MRLYSREGRELLRAECRNFWDLAEVMDELGILDRTMLILTTAQYVLWLTKKLRYIRTAYNYIDTSFLILEPGTLPASGKTLYDLKERMDLVVGKDSGTGTICLYTREGLGFEFYAPEGETESAYGAPLRRLSHSGLLMDDTFEAELFGVKVKLPTAEAHLLHHMLTYSLPFSMPWPDYDQMQWYLFDIDMDHLLELIRKLDEVDLKKLGLYTRFFTRNLTKIPRLQQLYELDYPISEQDLWWK